MTVQEINMAVAKACGWTDFHRGDVRLFGRPTPDSIRVDVPDYGTDLNACHEMEKVLNNHQYFDIYIPMLRSIMPRSTRAIIMDENEVSATAAQRREAFLRTIGALK